MDKLENFLKSFVCQSKTILEDNLTGIYLHGSAAMGCFHEKKSDIDLLVVIKESLSNEIKRRYMDRIVSLNRQAPAKGIELSIVRQDVCDPFVYPTPFELHFSITYLNWYRSNPDDYVAKMQGTDKDLAAHFTILQNRGKVLYGKALKEVFAEVQEEYYFDSIWNDICGAREEILENPMYVTLNLCRVLAFKEEKCILSKQEGGEWGIAHLPEKYIKLISDALTEYAAGGCMELEEELAKEYAEYMIKQIGGENRQEHKTEFNGEKHGSRDSYMRSEWCGEKHAGKSACGKIEISLYRQ